jgi:acyl carrier protein
VDRHLAGGGGQRTMTTEDRALDVVASVLKTPRATLVPDASTDTIAGWDSLRHLQLILALEEAFAIQFAVEEIEAMQSVGVILAILETHVPRSA